MKFIRDYFKSKRRDAIAQRMLPLLWEHDLNLIGRGDAADMRLLPQVLSSVAYDIADAMEMARNA